MDTPTPTIASSAPANLPIALALAQGKAREIGQHKGEREQRPDNHADPDAVDAAEAAVDTERSAVFLRLPRHKKISRKTMKTEARR